MNLIESGLSQKLIGAAVCNTAHGEGYITNFFLKDDGKYYVSVLFESQSAEKTFLASTAFVKRILVLNNEDLNKAVTLILGRHDIKSINDKQKSTAKSRIKISSNDIINILIDSVLDNEQIALDLVSFYDDGAFEKELCEEAFQYLEKIMNGANLSTAYKACIVCALSMIALKYYDGDLHSHIEKKFREYRPKTEYKYSKASIQKGVYKALGDFRSSTKYFDSHSYVAVPLVMSCVPHYRLKDLFIISYDIYKRKLLFDEDLGDDQIEEKVMETLVALRRKDLISDSDTIKGTNYLMSKYTQSCVYSGYGIVPLSQIITHCIRLIISYLTRPEDSFTVEPYYSEGYAAWVSGFEADDKEKTRYETNRTTSQPYLKLVNNKIHLFTGEYSMDDSYTPNDVHVCIYNSGVLVEDRLISDPNSIEYIDDESAMSGYIIRRQELIISGSPLGELSYSISCSGRRLYDSKTRLYRSNLFFDGKGREVKPGINYNGELFVITKKSNKEEFGDSINEVYQGDGYIISIAEVNELDVFYFDGEPYTFYKISSSQLISYEVPWCDFISAEGKRFPIYNDVSILFPSSCEKEEIYLEIDGQDYYYGDDADIYFSLQVFSREYGETWVYVAKVHELEAGFHTIRVLNSISNKQIKGANFSIVYDPNAWKSYVSKDNMGILYELSGSFVDNQLLPFEYGVFKKELKVFIKNLGHGSFTVYPSSISYSIDGIVWKDIDERVNLYEIPESIKTLRICGPSGIKTFYIDKAAVVKKQEVSIETSQENPMEYQLHLSFLRTLFEQKFAKISFEYGNRSKYMIVAYYPFVLKKDCSFYFDKDKGIHIFDIRFEGTSKLKAVIKPLHSDSALVSKVIRSGELIEINDSDIDNDVRFLSIALHGRKYGALFDPYQSKPFMVFPKYDLGRLSVKLTTFPPVFMVDNGILSGRIGFVGETCIKADIIPSGFNTPLLSKIIHNGDRLSLDISILPFNSYKIRLFNIYDKEENCCFEKPFYISKAVKVKSPFLKQSHTISSFILSDGTKTNTMYSVYYKTIEEINKKYYLVASLMDKAGFRKFDNLYFSVKKRSGLKYEVAMRHRINNAFVRLKLKNGQFVDRAIINKTGGWL